MVKNLPASAGDARDVGSVSGLGGSPGVGNGTYSSILAWKSPWAWEPGGLQSRGPQRAGHDWAHTHTKCLPSPEIKCVCNFPVHLDLA